MQKPMIYWRIGLFYYGLGHIAYGSPMKSLGFQPRLGQPLALSHSN